MILKKNVLIEFKICYNDYKCKRVRIGRCVIVSKVFSPFIYFFKGILVFFRALISIFYHAFLALPLVIKARKIKPDETPSEEEVKFKQDNAGRAILDTITANEDNDFNIDITAAEEDNEEGSLTKFGKKLMAIPEKIREQNTVSLIKKYTKNKGEPVPLTINYDGPDAVKSKDKQVYEYIIKTPEGRYQKGYFSAFSKVEVYSFLRSEGNIVYSIRTNKWLQTTHNNIAGNSKIKIKDLNFLLTQLSTYLKAGIPLADSVKILVKQFNNKNYQRILRGVVYDLSIGKNFSEALEKQGKAFPQMLINMVRAAEMTGELPETLDDMAEYFAETEATRKAMVTAMMYPVIIFVIAIAVGTFIMLYVVPQFVEIYESMDDAEIPGITLFVLAISDFLQKYIIIIGVAVILLLLVIIYLYRHVKPFRRAIQLFGMKSPGFGNIIIYNEVTMFTKTFASLLAHNVFITDSMTILNKVTNNEIYKGLIIKAINNIAKGGKISTAFKDHWAFPIPAYEMIVTGEKTGQLPEMMQKVAVYYQDLHRNAITRIKTFIEPILILLLTGMVGVIVLAIVVPMFNMYGSIQQ